MSPADTARANGWTVGTRLYGSATAHERDREIIITAIGEESVLAKMVKLGGVDEKRPRECSYGFDHGREWSVIDDKEQAV